LSTQKDDTREVSASLRNGPIAGRKHRLSSIYVAVFSCPVFEVFPPVFRPGIEQASH
jgi:hypothetical protein